MYANAFEINNYKQACLWYFKSIAELGLHHAMQWSIQNIVKPGEIIIV